MVVSLRRINKTAVNHNRHSSSTVTTASTTIPDTPREGGSLTNKS